MSALTTEERFGIIQADPKPITPPPAVGWHDAVLVDWYDEGWTNIGRRLELSVRLCWQIAERKKNGRRHFITRRFHRSMHAKATLRQWLERWRGRPYLTNEVLAGIALEMYVGQPCHLNLSVTPYSDGSGRHWVNVEQLNPWNHRCGRWPLQPEEVIRVKGGKKHYVS